MTAFFKNRINRGALRIAFTSFLLGHLFFLQYLAFPVDGLFGLGLVFVVLFITIHVLLLATLFLNALINYRDYEENMTAFIVSFLNVPLAAFYITLI